jgi:hypothetical protein
LLEANLSSDEVVEGFIADHTRSLILRQSAARVAVMRRIATIFWHMLKYHEAYTIGGPPLRLRKPLAAGSPAE